MSRRLVPLVALAFAVSTSVAQPPATQPPAQRTPYDPYRQVIDGALRFVNHPAIQAELKLTDEQKAKLRKIPADLLAKHKEAIDKAQNAAREANEKATAETAERAKALDALLEKHLTADQRKRFDQLTVQAMGQNAFSHAGILFDAEISKALGLTEENRQKLAELRRAEDEKLNKEFSNFNPFSSDPETQQKYLESRLKASRDTLRQFVASLSAEQQKAWKELTGEPCAAVETGFLGGGRVSVFGFGTRAAGRLDILHNRQAAAELKLEKAAADALADGLMAFEANLSTDPRFITVSGPQALSSKVLVEAKAAAEEVLTPTQARRLEQVKFQLDGLNAFMPILIGYDSLLLESSEFQATPGSPTIPLLRLSLTPAQVVKIDAVIAELAKKVAQLPGFPFTRATPETVAEVTQQARAERQQKIRELIAKATAEILNTLDAGQKAVWKELAGEPFDVSKAPDLDFSTRNGFMSSRSLVTILNRWNLEATRRMRSEEYAAALAVYDDALRLNPAFTPAVLGKARLLAACPSDLVRDGKRAVEIMTKAMAETKEPSFNHYNTLAAAYAEVGQFVEAVKAQQKAIEVLPKSAELGQTPAQLKRQYEGRLKLYQDKKPYRISPPTPAPTPGGGSSTPGR